MLGNASEASRAMGCSRDGFYRFTELYDTGGEAAPQGSGRRNPVPSDRVAPEIEAAALEKAKEEQEAYGEAETEHPGCLGRRTLGGRQPQAGQHRYRPAGLLRRPPQPLATR